MTEKQHIFVFIGKLLHGIPFRIEFPISSFPKHYIQMQISKDAVFDAIVISDVDMMETF